MAIVTVKNKFQVVIPRSVRNQIGVSVGDLLDARAERGRIVLKPKVVVDRDEYTPAQRRRIDAQLAKSLAEHKEGKSFGPFKTHQEMADFLHRQAKKSRTRAARRSNKHRPR
jgi:AbrB family looped-hinge helix DNA binding protein